MQDYLLETTGISLKDFEIWRNLNKPLRVPLEFVYRGKPPEGLSIVFEGKLNVPVEEIRFFKEEFGSLRSIRRLMDSNIKRPKICAIYNPIENSFMLETGNYYLWIAHYLDEPTFELNKIKAPNIKK
jgi:hypothetical protein